MKKVYLCIGIALVVIDQLIKQIMINKYITIIPNVLSFTYTKNLGAAFGIGSRYIILILSIVIIICMLYVLLKYKKIDKYYLPYTFILSGAFGNLIDRMFREYVIDYIDVNIINFPNFNIADICITLGILLLAINVIKSEID